MTDTIQHVSTSYVCDRETRELGEDYGHLGILNEDFRHFLACLSLTRRFVQSARAKECLRELEVLIADARHDAAFGATLALARDAHEEAKVVPMRRAPKLTVVS